MSPGRSVFITEMFCCFFNRKTVSGPPSCARSPCRQWSPGHGRLDNVFGQHSNGGWCSQDRAPLYWEADMRSVFRVARLWSWYRLGNALTARSVEGRVPKPNIGLVRYRRETDCPADSGQLVTRGKLLEIFTKRTFYLTSFRCRRDMFLFIFLKWFWCGANLQSHAHATQGPGKARRSTHDTRCRT